MTVLKNAVQLAVARVLSHIPSMDELLQSMNKQDSLSDGSRSL